MATDTTEPTDNVTASMTLRTIEGELIFHTDGISVPALWLTMPYGDHVVRAITHNVNRIFTIHLVRTDLAPVPHGR